MRDALYRLAALALALAACATVADTATGGPPPFQGVKSLALARWNDDPSTPRPKDPLDALKESLDGRGYQTRVVELGPRMPSSPEARELARLFEAVRSRAASGGREAWARSAGGADPQAGKVVAALGVDAVALYHRFDDRASPAYADAPAAASPFGTPRTAFPPFRPLGALSLVDRGGRIVSFAWGSQRLQDPQLDPSAPVNAAEAVDDVIRALTGEPAEQ